MELPAFLSQKPPPGYVAGIGRGATGFTTRSDIGSGKVPGRVRDDREMPLGADENENGDADEEGIGRNAKVRFEDSNGLSLVSNNVGQNDEEADRIYLEIDARLSNSKTQKKADIENVKKPDSNLEVTTGITAVSQAFVDLKRSLATVSDEQWENLPEAGDFTRRNKRQRIELQNERKTYAAPDTLMAENIDLTKLTQEREKLLGRQLDESLNGRDGNAQNARNETDQYLRDLDDSIKTAELNTDVQDVGRMRTILNSYRKSDPKRPQGWIASARLEEKAKKYPLAKSLIEEGCNACPRDEDIWLENIRLNATDLHYCKILVARALSFNDESIKLWLKAVELENETLNKVRVVRKALQSLPTSPELWKLAVQYEADRIEAIKILKKATELMPDNIELLTALINLQDHLDARKTLNTARKNNPDKLQVWILAIELEERRGSSSLEKLVKLLGKGLQELAKHGTEITVEQLFQEASQIEAQFTSSYELTLRALVKVAVDLHFGSQTYNNAVTFIDSISYNGLAKSFAYRYVLEKEPRNFVLWRRFLELCRVEKHIGEVYDAFETALFKNQTTILRDLPVLALMYSKEIWKVDKNTLRALDIIDRSLECNPDCVDFWLAKIKLLILDWKHDDAESLFKTAIDSLNAQPGFDRVCHRYIGFLRFQDRNPEALEMLETKFLAQQPACDKLFLQWGQIYQDTDQPKKARECFFEGTKKIPQSARLWIALARADKDLLGLPVKARSDLEMALLKVPAGTQQDHLLVARIQMERELSNIDQARLLVSQGLRVHPDSASLWVENLKLIAKKSQRKTAYQDALERTKSHHQVLIAIGTDLFADAQYGKALKWFQRATTAAPLFGDGWIWYSRCLQRMGRGISEILTQVDEQEPRYGAEWIKAAKQPHSLCLTPSQLLVKSI
ncbi:LAME_0H13542g1_1 [Lachancea meyersii CBS 8951]|uniref:LAME_0H13542g1_1 n=1 Tax=Lachancea meyersii CBS 8951 TaxID=1266667 RepID=A0A1G4KHC0_9SACH|nr:LAME_0H13542g1_1 [Lachancea meyersii CBS 8951]